jgi:hypothetical protein
MARNIENLRQAIDRKILEVCRQEVASAGSEGPAAIDDRLACRIDRLSRILSRID